MSTETIIITTIIVKRQHNDKKNFSMTNTCLRSSSLKIHALQADIGCIIIFFYIDFNTTAAPSTQLKSTFPVHPIHSRVKSDLSQETEQFPNIY